MNLKKIVSKKFWFTLTELVVVVIVIAILATMSFIWINWLIKDSRDSSRIATLKNIETAMEWYNTKTWRYPLPDDSRDITFSGAKLWKQWMFWDRNIKQLWRLNKLPVDVLTDSYFGYSLVENWYEYQIWTVIEGSVLGMNIINWANAAGWIIAESYNIWNYNWKMLKTKTGGLLYVLAIPSIITNSSDATDIAQISSEQRLTYTRFNNLSYSYRDTIFDVEWWFNFDPSMLVVYSWTEEDLLFSENKRLELAASLQAAYSWTIIMNDSAFNDLVHADFTTDTKAAREVAYILIENDLNYDLPVVLTSGPNWLTYDVSNSLIDNDTRSIAQDLWWNIWFATKMWVNKFGWSVWIAYDESDWLANKDTRDVLPDSSWNIWFATNKWVSKYDWTTWTTLDKTDWLINNDVVSIIEDSSWNMWMATLFWVSKYDWTTWTNYNHTDWLANKQVKMISEDPVTWDIWFATINWVSMFDGTTWTSYNESDWLVDKNVLSVYVDNSWNAWFGTFKWASKFDWLTWDTYNINDWLADNDVQVIFEDSDSNMWFGTKKWVTIYFN